jgi:hypothetical protein
VKVELEDLHRVTTKQLVKRRRMLIITVRATNLFEEPRGYPNDQDRFQMLVVMKED